MIEVEALHKRLGDVVAVDEVSFSAHDGHITGVLGPNGAGKTTSLRILTGLMAADRGQVTIDGIDVASRPRQARRRLGVLPDSRGLYGRLSARENIRYYGRLYGLSGDDLERRVDELLSLLELEPLADRRTHGMSLGERMKVAIARAIVHRPANLVLDEPTTGLDVMSVRALRRFLRRLRAQGTCIVLASHVMQEVAVLCDRIVVLAAGRVVACGSPSALSAAHGLASLEDTFVKLTLGDRYLDDDGGAP
jgi:sodium transport system ATP-binding protein